MMKKLHKLPLLMLMGTLFWASCRKEEMIQPKTEKQTLSISDARSWFIAEHGGYGKTKSTADSATVPFIPVWDNAFAEFNEKYEVVEVPIMEKVHMSYADEESRQVFDSTGNLAYMNTIARLMVIRDRTTNKTESYKMSISASKAYLEKHNFELEKITFLDKTSDFDGKVHIHNMDGDFVGAWVFEKGKVTGVLRPDAKSTKSMVGIYDNSNGMFYTHFTDMSGTCTYLIETTSIVHTLTFKYWSDGKEYRYIDSYTLFEETRTTVLYCTLGDGISGGGGGTSGGGDPNEGNKNSNPNSPCGTLNGRVANNKSLISVFRRLDSLTLATNKEWGAFFTYNTTTGVYGLGGGRFQQGEPGYIRLEVPPTKVGFYGYIHTHNKGEGSIFSYGDFFTLHQLYDLMAINTESFFFGVITADGGNAYMLMIEDKDAFIKWIYEEFYGPMDKDRLQAKSDEFYENYKADKGDYESREAEYIRFLQEKNTGLKLYKGNKGSYTQWEGRAVDGSKRTYSIKCN